MINWQKRALYDDYTWEYADMGRPAIDTADSLTPGKEQVYTPSER